MLFVPIQVEKMLKIIDFQHLLFISENIGIGGLSNDDKAILKEYGIDIDQNYNTTFTPYQKIFYFGKLAGALRKQTKKVTFNDFQKYLQKGQFQPLTKVEQNALKFLEGKTTNYIKQVSSQVKSSIQGLILDRTQAYDIKTTKQFKSQIKEGIKQRNSKQEILSDIGHLTGKWEKDLGRIVDTEMQNCFQYGIYLDILEREGADVLLYKDVFSGACKNCINLYLTAGIGSEPILFTPQQLLENGSNVGRRQAEWKATLGPVHPWCYSSDTEVMTDKGWRLFGDLDGSEKFLSLDLKTKVWSYLRAREYYRYQYKGPVWHRHGDHIDMITTPDHKHPMWTFEGYQLVDEKYLQKNAGAFIAFPNCQEESIFIFPQDYVCEEIEYDGIVSCVELIRNHTLLVRRCKSSKVVLGGNCRCQLHFKRPDEVWNKEKNDYVMRDYTEEAKKIRGMITIQVGDKIFEV